MDALSQLVQLTLLQGSLDLRCQLAGRFAVDHAPRPDGEVPFHLVLAGRCVMELQGHPPLALATGDLVLLPRGHAHRIRDDGATDTAGPLQLETHGALPLRRNTDGAAELDLLCGRFHTLPGTTDLLLAALPDVLHVPLADSADLDTLRALIALLRTEVQHAQPGALAIVTALSSALFVLALRTHAQRGGTPACLLALLIEPRLGRAVQAMLREPGKAWTVASLAELAAMSRATFARQFQAHGGLAPWELLTRLRVQLAGHQLRHGRDAVAEIAQQVGYQSEAAFAKVFRRHTGLTPARYRRQREGITPSPLTREV